MSDECINNKQSVDCVEKKEAVCHQLDVSDIFIKARLITAIVCYSGVCRDCKGQLVFVDGSDHRER